MSNIQQSFNAGQTQGQTKATAEQMIQSAKETAHAATQSQSVQQAARQEQNPGFLQQTGEQVMGMAQGVVESLKNTMGMNDTK